MQENEGKYSFTIPLTREQLEFVRGKLSLAGFKLIGDSGEGKFKGITFSYLYQEAYSQIRLTIEEKSFITKMVSDRDVEELVKENVEKCLKDMSVKEESA